MLTGLAMVMMNALGVKLGFGFSAGLFDYVLNFGKATRPLLLLPVGIAYSALYYALFRFVIARFDLPTPGRERDAPTAARRRRRRQPRPGLRRGAGRSGEPASVDACTTRLRLIVVDQAAVDVPNYPGCSGFTGIVAGVAGICAEGGGRLAFCGCVGFVHGAPCVCA